MAERHHKVRASGCRFAIPISSSLSFFVKGIAVEINMLYYRIKRLTSTD